MSEVAVKKEKRQTLFPGGDPPHPIIDSDPHFTRVVRYFRPSDYAAWAVVTAAFPGALAFLQHVDPMPLSRKGMTPALRLATTMGFFGGFLWAYQNSCHRFLGLEPNRPELEKDHAELSALRKAGKPLYGESSESEFIQKVAHSNSQFAFMKFGVMPWFNFVNHPYHGVNPARYDKPLPPEGEPVE